MCYEISKNEKSSVLEFHYQIHIYTMRQICQLYSCDSHNMAHFKGTVLI